ncbi:MAG: (E)-4-hydroxy-3-methylbut-2-enyl-diphosphate synthase [Bacteroidota bacterium]|nr:(E)-4-hydroxy-3-methylbut-2-enyl-diphosphate synthase [Bacteroidota bacterium]
MKDYFNKNLFKYNRRTSIPVKIGNIEMGGNNPIRIQSMTTTDTMDTNATVNQSIRMINAGCELVRVTAPSIKDAKNLRNIKDELNKKGYNVPLVADIHFTPNAAEIAAEIVEKVRINPGNYADKKKFQQIEYDDKSYNDEIERIYERVSPLIKICKTNGTAMRIGTNHGSLSDRIMSRFGDTPLGMVESALEYLRICEDHNYHNIVLSMKASNPLVMVHAYRLLVDKLNNSNLKDYPLHLGVTEAGEGEDGRIKSAIGIGTLLDDGIGDTIRVSLTEEPEFESPVAKLLVNRYNNRANHTLIKQPKNINFSPFKYEKRESNELFDIGGDNFPIVISSFSNLEKLDKNKFENLGITYNTKSKIWEKSDTSPDYIYIGDSLNTEGINYQFIVDYSSWLKDRNKKNYYPLLTFNEFIDLDENLFSENINFLMIQTTDLEKFKNIRIPENFVLILNSNNEHFMPDMRSFFLKNFDIKNPVILSKDYDLSYSDDLIIHSSTDIGGLFIQGYGDGIFISNHSSEIKEIKKINNLSFKILQAARVRVTSTDFISCPSCGRTLFDLQETTAMIRERTDHLKGLKIGIMGCIVNGPGEMADADYGYVGSGVDKITLYRGQEVVKRGINFKYGVDELVNLIKEDGNWIEP